ncbi:MAG: hypothetical protein CMJ83_05790 [Planctomycetes bacterium]|nr:hypothetical protein [Planctomycetota bacterium]
MMRLIPILLIVGGVTADVAAQSTLKVHHIRVGQASSALIVSPTGQTCLVDAASSGGASTGVLPLLASLGISFLDHVVLTHYHTDHWGGIPTVVGAGVGVGTAWDRGNANVTSNINSYLSAVGSARTTMTPGTVIDLGGGATLTCIVVNGSVLGGGFSNPANGSQEENSRSIGLRLEYGNYDEAICGDLTGGSGTANIESTAAPVMGDVDVMVLSHHGSSTSTNSTWVNTLAAEIGVISCGNSNPFGHPHVEALAEFLGHPNVVDLFRLETGSSNPGGTTVNGTLLVDTDGATYTVSGGLISPTTYNVDETGPVGPGPSNHIAGDVIVSEYLQNPLVVSDGDGEWVELANTTASPIDLNGFILRDHDVDSVVLPAITLPARGFVVLARNDNPQQNGGVNANWEWPFNGFFLSNASDEIEVVDPTGQVLDTIVYDNGATFPDPTGKSVERRDLQAQPWASNFGEATTLFGGGDLGTPGAGNSLDVTLPWVTLAAIGSITPGGNLTFAMNAGFLLGGKGYVIGFSECVDPPIIFPSGKTVDLCLTPLLGLSTQVVPGFVGTLNPFGIATVPYSVPNAPGLIGLTFYMSGIVLDPGQSEGLGAIIDNATLAIN